MCRDRHSHTLTLTLTFITRTANVCARSSARQRDERVARAACERGGGGRVRHRVLRHLRLRARLPALLRQLRALPGYLSVCVLVIACACV